MGRFGGVLLFLEHYWGLFGFSYYDTGSMTTGTFLNLTFLIECSGSGAKTPSCFCISVLKSAGIEDILNPFSEVTIGGVSGFEDELDRLPLDSRSTLFFQILY